MGVRDDRYNYIVQDIELQANSIFRHVKGLRALRGEGAGWTYEGYEDVIPAEPSKVKRSEFLNAVEEKVKHVRDRFSATLKRKEALSSEEMNAVKEDLRSLRRLAASSYARAAGYAALRLLVLPFVSLVTVAIGLAYVVSGKSVRDTIQCKINTDVPLNFAERTVDKTFRTYDRLKLKRNQSFRIASNIGLFGGVGHQAKKAIEAAYQLETPKNQPEAPKKQSNFKT